MELRPSLETRRALKSILGTVNNTFTNYCMPLTPCLKGRYKYIFSEAYQDWRITSFYFQIKTVSKMAREDLAESMKVSRDSSPWISNISRATVDSCIRSGLYFRAVLSECQQNLQLSLSGIHDNAALVSMICASGLRSLLCSYNVDDNGIHKVLGCKSDLAAKNWKVRLSIIPGQRKGLQKASRLERLASTHLGWWKTTAQASYIRRSCTSRRNQIVNKLPCCTNYLASSQSRKPLHP